MVFVAGLVDDGPGLPDDDPVGLLLDDISSTVFVPAMVVSALALAELGRAAEEEDIEVGPPVGEEVVAAEEVTEEAAFVGTNPAIELIRPFKEEQEKPTNTILIDIENRVDVLQEGIT
jgi:hypothetical protein